MAVQDGVILSKRGDVTFGWEVILPTAFTVNEAGYDSIIESFLQAYRLLPVYCIVHKQDVYCYDTYHASGKGHFLVSAYERHHDGKRFLNGHSYIYLTFSNKKNIERTNTDSGYFGIYETKWARPEYLAECASMAGQFESVLKNNPLLGIRALQTEDLLCLREDGSDGGTIADYLNMYRPEGPDYSMEFHNDKVCYGDDMLKVWYVEDSDAYEGLVSSVTYVQEMSSGSAKIFLSGGSPIGYRLRIPHVVNRYIVTLPKNTVEAELDQKKRMMNSFSLYSARDRVNASELQAYLDASANESTTTVKCHMNLMAWGSQSTLAEVSKDIVTAFRSNLKVAVVEERRVAPLLHYAAIPGAAAELGYDNYLTSEILAFCCHGLWDGYDFGMRNGLVHVCDRETMTPVVIDIQQEARNRGFINGMNALVVGPTGSGKSFTMNSLVQDFYEAGQHIFIIDVGDSYQGYCQVVNEESGGVDGVYNTYNLEKPFGFNPFRNFRRWNDLDEDGERVNSGYDFFLSLLKSIYRPEGGWSKVSSSVLKHLVTTFLDWWQKGEAPAEVSENLLDAHMNERRRRAEKNSRKMDEEKARLGFRDAAKELFNKDCRGVDPIFDDFYQYVSRVIAPLMRDENFTMGEIVVDKGMLNADQFAAAMDMYKKDGVYGFLLNAKDEPDLFKSRLTVFEVDKIKDNEDLFPLWVLLIMHSFEDKMRSLRCQKVMIIEEAWKAIATPEMADFIVWMWRTARKFSTSAVVVTQDILDLTGSAVVKDAIIMNSDVRIILDHRGKEANLDKGCEVLKLSNMQKNLILSVNASLHPGRKYKEGFFCIGSGYSNVFAIEVSPEQAIAYESNKDIKGPVLERGRECGSIIQAIKEYVSGNK